MKKPKLAALLFALVFAVVGCATVTEEEAATTEEEAVEEETADKNTPEQDVSNIPKTPNEREECLNAYLESFGDDAGEEQQRVATEAHRRGVSRYAVVGC